MGVEQHHLHLELYRHWKRLNVFHKPDRECVSLYLLYS